MGRKRGRKGVSFGGGVSAHLALFFSPGVCYSKQSGQ